MNQHRYRIVFNKVRGLLMAVAESVHSSGKAAAGERDAAASVNNTTTTAFTLRQTAFNLLLAFGCFWMAADATAQIIANRAAPGNQQPTILNSANGVPQVNIQTPNGAGVSVNNYSQFNVQSNGVILNNSRTNVQTQLGGWVQGNPWLAAGSAKTIVNQVSSSNPSTINGWIEIAGQRADLIIANPSGLIIQGGGIINGAGVSLTTGQPQYNPNGAVSGFNVQNGLIRIEGAGFDARNTDYVGVYARAAQINANFWANYAKVAVGPNQIAYGADGAIIPITADPNNKPQLALDVAYLGGIYANKIFLIGTERGLGVNIDGSVAAANNFHLTNDGKIVIDGQTQSGGNTTIKATDDVTNSGTVYAGSNSRITSAGNVSNTGTIAAQGNVSIRAQSINSSANSLLGAGVAANGSMTGNATGNLRIQTADTQTLNGKNLAAGNVSLSGSSLDLSGSQTLANGNIALNADNQINATNATIGAGGDLGIQSRSTTTNPTSNLTLAVINTGANLSANGNLSVTAFSLTGDGSITAKGNLGLTLFSDFNNIRQLIAGGNATLTTTGNITNSGTLQAGQTLTLNAQNLDNTVSGDISGNVTQLAVTSNLSNHGIIDGGDTRLDAANVNNLGTGRIYGGNLSIAATNLTNDTETVNGVTSAGTLAARNRLDLGISNTLTNREGALIYSVGDMALGGGLDSFRQAFGKAAQINNNSATIEADGNLSIGAVNLQNTNDHFTYEIRISNVQPDQTQTITDRLYYTYTRTTYTPYQVTSSPAQIIAGGNLTLSADTARNYASHIVAGQTLTSIGNTLVNEDVLATETDRDIGEVHTLVHIPQSGSCGYISFHCVRAHDEWQTAPYDNSTYRTVVVAQTVPVQSSGYAIGNLSAATVNGTTGPNLPTSSFYKLQPASSPYLIETDSRFTNYKTWLSSDYMFNALSVDPATVQQRLGDAFYEQKLIDQQITNQTGQRYLTGYASTDDEYKALMTAGVTYAKQYNLRLGIALTADQMAKLTSDIVWLVSQTVTLPDGSTRQVLVPQVYLAPGSLDTGRNGAQLAGTLISANNVQISQSGNVMNSGAIAGRNTVNIAANNLNNAGNISGNAVTLTAQQDINVTGGNVAAQSSLNANAGRDLNVTTTTQSTASSTNNGQFGTTSVDRVGSLTVANGSLAANAGRDINLTAANIQSNTSAGASTGSARTAGVMTANGSTVRPEPVEGQNGAQAQPGSITLSAGNNLNLATVTTGQKANVVWDKNNTLRYDTTSETGSNVSGNNVNLIAGNDLNARAANVTASGNLTAQATNNLTITTGNATTDYAEAHKTQSGSFLNSSTLITRETSNSSTAIGSSFSGSNVTLNAGKDASITGSSVNAQNTLNVTAGQDVNVNAATNTQNGTYYSETHSSGFMTNKEGFGYGISSNRVNGNYSSTTLTSSTLSGGSVNITAQRDATVTASNVVADNNLNIVAGQNVNLVAGTETSQSAQSSKQSSTFLNLNPNGFKWGVTVFNNIKMTADGTSNSTTAVGSMIGSLSGNVAINAGKTYTQTGSDVLTPQGDIAITAKDVNILEARQTSSSTDRQTMEKTEVSVSASSGIIDTAQSAWRSAKAITGPASTQNKVLNGLILFAKEEDLRNQSGPAVVDAAKTNGVFGTSAGTDDDGNATAAKPGATAASGVKISVTLGHSESKSESSSQSDSAVGSTVKAGGNITLVATGDQQGSGIGNQGSVGGSTTANASTVRPEPVEGSNGAAAAAAQNGAGTGNITVQGSNVSAGNNVSLSAANNLNLVASADTASNKSTNSSHSESIGVGFGVGAGSNGFTIDIGASLGKGHANSDSLSYNNTQITAGNTASLSSGKDTNLIGANVNGSQVTANVGGDLNIQSLQDTAQSNAEQKSMSAAVSIPIGTGTGSASFSQNEQNSRSNYNSVNQQSGIQAGNGGFNISVNGNTDLKGGFIASTADPSKNTLTTGSLTTSDISNSMSASASSNGLSLSSSMLDGKYAAIKGIAMNALNNGDASQSDSSTTRSAISAGQITVGGKTTDTSKDALTDSNGKTVSTDTANTNRTLAKADVENLQSQAQQKQADNALIYKAVTTYTDETYRVLYQSGGKVYRVPPGCSNQSCATELSEAEVKNLQASQDGAIHITNNGIYNNLDDAVRLAQQHGGTVNDDGSKDYSNKPDNQYIIFAPMANNFLSELLAAGVQKSGLTPYVGLTDAEARTAQIINQTAQNGQKIEIDSHSRGSLTTTNAETYINNQGGVKDTEGNTVSPNIVMYNYGAAQNNKTGNSTLQELTGKKDAQINSIIHPNDFVGTVVGWNDATTSYISTTKDGVKTEVKFNDDQRSGVGNFFNILFGKATPHNCGGTSGGTADCTGQWTKIPVSNATPKTNPNYTPSIVVPYYPYVDKTMPKALQDSNSQMKQLLQFTSPALVPSTMPNSKLESLVKPEVGGEK